MISAPFFISAIWSLIGEPPYAQTAWREGLGVVQSKQNNDTHAKTEDAEEGLTLPVNLHCELASWGHDNGNRALHLL